tara:strand:- start:3 stop:245 length:243 start_codon:yes stop_codon:yes gene_type:complete
MKKNNLGKGFKRIYIVFSGIWIAIIYFQFLLNYGEYKTGGDFACSDAACVMENFIGSTAVAFLPVIIIYFIIKWVVEGFK